MFRQIMSATGLLMLALMMPVFAAEEGTSGVEEEFPFESEAQREQFRKLTNEMRCPKCLNSNLAGSDAPVAQELTDNIYRQIREGRSNEEIIEFMTSRYGDFIIYRPPLTAGTFLLWFGPALLLLAGFIFVWRTARSDGREGGVLTPEDERKLQRLLSEEKEKQ